MVKIIGAREHVTDLPERIITISAHIKMDGHSMCQVVLPAATRSYTLMEMLWALGFALTADGHASAEQVAEIAMKGAEQGAAAGTGTGSADA